VTEAAGQGLSTPWRSPPAPLTAAIQRGAQVPKAHREQSAGGRGSAPAQPAGSLLHSSFRRLQQRSFPPGRDSCYQKPFLDYSA